MSGRWPSRNQWRWNTVSLLRADTSEPRVCISPSCCAQQLCTGTPVRPLWAVLAKYQPPYFPARNYRPGEAPRQNGKHQRKTEHKLPNCPNDTAGTDEESSAKFSTELLKTTKKIPTTERRQGWIMQTQHWCFYFSFICLSDHTGNLNFAHCQNHHSHFGSQVPLLWHKPHQSFHQISSGSLGAGCRSASTMSTVTQHHHLAKVNSSSSSSFPCL